VVLYEMLTGKRPFSGSSPAGTMQNVLDAEPPLPSKVNPDVPSVVDLLVWNMLAKDPDDRVPNAEIVARHLRALSEEVDDAFAAHADDRVPAGAATTAGGRASGHRCVALVPGHGGAPQRAKLRLPSYAWVALILAAAGSGLLWEWRRSPDQSEMRSAAISEELATAIASEPSVPDEPRLAASEPEPKERTSKAPAGRPPGSAVTSGAPAPKIQASVAALATAPEIPPANTTTGVLAPAARIEASVAELATAPEIPPAKTATLVFDVSPWGEIYVDGKPHGTTPPVKTLDLPPGRHRIEVRNSAQLPHLSFATLEPGDVRRIQHAFE
jgi:serine/threonine-protein kinase